jgi:hypothetical protein
MGSGGDGVKRGRDSRSIRPNIEARIQIRNVSVYKNAFYGPIVPSWHGRSTAGQSDQGHLAKKQFNNSTIQQFNNSTIQQFNNSLALA